MKVRELSKRFVGNQDAEIYVSTSGGPGAMPCKHLKVVGFVGGDDGSGDLILITAKVKLPGVVQKGILEC